MTCKYILKTGKDTLLEFKNEAALTLALLTKYELFQEFGDVVFNLTLLFTRTLKKLEELHKLGEEKLAYIEKYYQSKNNQVEYDEDGQIILMEKPAMGVNRFLATYLYRDEDTGKMKQVVPEFRQEVFWENKKQQWKNRLFPDKDKKLIQDIEGEDFDFTNQDLITDAKIETWLKAILVKWDAQGKTGTALHAVSEKFFSKTTVKDSNTGEEVEKYNFELLEENPNIIGEWYEDFSKDLDLYKTITYGDFVNEALFGKMLDMCKKLKALIEEEFGEGCAFFPELSVASKITAEVDGCNELVGIIDLLVVDSKGIPHIYDYKTSPKPYRDYDSAKVRAFTYLLAVYDRILQHFGIHTEESCKIVPIQLNNFRLENGNYVYDDIGFTINLSERVDVRDLTNIIRMDLDISRTINTFLPPDVTLEPISEELLEGVQNGEKTWFPSYNIAKNSTDQEIDDMLRKAGAYTPNKLGLLTFTFNSNEEPIVQDASEPNAEAKLHQKVKKEIESWSKKKANWVKSFEEAFNKAVKDGRGFLFYGTQNLGGDSLWLTNLITPYCNGDYELFIEPSSANLGMLYLRNLHNQNITVLKLTGALLDRMVSFGKGRTNINGKYATDIEENSKGESLMLKSYAGNIEAIEAMMALLHLDFGYNIKISEIKVINPKMQRAMPVSNKELFYTYKNLMEHESILKEGEEDKFRTKKYQLLTETAKLLEEFNHILKSDSYSKSAEFSDIVGEIREIMKPVEEEQTLDWNSIENLDKLLLDLNKLRIKLENTYSQQLRDVQTRLTEITSPEYKLYYQVMMAIKELRGVDTRLQIKDADNWILNGNFAKIFSEGWEGLMLENPGNFKSPALNQLTKSISNVYQKVKDRLNKLNRTLRKLMEDLKKESNYGWLSNNITGNETELFMDMTYEDNGDFLFVNPNTFPVGSAKRKFLEFALESINKDRQKGVSDAVLKQQKESNDPMYYRVPLMKASTASRRTTAGLLNSLYDRLKSWKPGNALKDAREKLEGFFFEEDEEREHEKLELYQIGTKFDLGLSDRREDLIKREGISGFEHNIETILLHHAYAYTLKLEMNNEMPIIKATAMCLAMQGAGANPPEGNFNHLISFIEDYINFAVKNKNINKNPLGKEGSEMVGKIKMATSILALGLSPLLFTYQTVEGIWKACALIWKKPDGTEAFTCKNMWEAFKSAYSDLAYYKTRPSKGMQINETYGINDMDSNLFAERISSDKSIWTHFTDFLFRFASRPDYYNRMTIFGAQMRKDGTWDAHYVDREGNLIYDWKLDKRYDAYAKNNKHDPRYLECKARYLAALLQFQKEGVYNENGSPLKVGDPLPRAYTNQEASAMKAVADNMYGYYNHETKSMLSATTMGALAMQMKTYWSAKKNQYLAPGGCKLMGHWEDYQEPKKDANGNIIRDSDGNPIMELLYYYSGANGEIDLSKGFVTVDDPNCSKIKVLLWKGQYQEGIISTLMRFGKTWKDSEQTGFAGFKEAWLDMWYNADDNLRTAYRSNIKHLMFDLVFMLGMGNIVGLFFGPEDDELKKAHYADRGNLDKAMAYAAYNFMYRTFKQSFMDFNFIDSIFSPTVDWQPMSFTSMTKLASNTWEYMTTDKSFASTLANSSAVTRQLKPLIRSLTYED